MKDKICNTVERHAARTTRDTVWSAICLGSMLLPVFIQGNITDRRYIDDALDPYGVHIPIQDFEEGIFQQDKAHLYITRVVIQFF